MPKTKPKRIRITRQDIEKARGQLQKEPRIAPKTTYELRENKPKSFWDDDNFFHDTYGCVWDVKDNLESVFVKRNKVSPKATGNKDTLLDTPNKLAMGIDLFLKTPAIENTEYVDNGILVPLSNSKSFIVATFRPTAHWSRFLRPLVYKGMGILQIRNELKELGFFVPLKVLRRRISQISEEGVKLQK